MHRLLLLALALAGAAGCFVVQAPAEKADKDDKKEETSPENGATDCAESGMPAAVQAMLVERCQSCHGAEPKSPMALVTYDDLLAPAPSDESRTVAALVLERIQSADAPMPPSKNGVTVPQVEIDAFQAWIDAETPRAEGACESADGGAKTDPEVTPTVCTSDTTWNPQGSDDDDDDDHGAGPRMNPGKACIGCHEATEGKPILQVGGTVYPTVHEPDLCWGAGTADAKVVVIGADGVEWPMALTDTGNFSQSTRDDQIAFPITARVELADGSVREMSSPQDSGDCNSCHTEQGKNGAPGRIFLP